MADFNVTGAARLTVAGSPPATAVPCTNVGRLQGAVQHLDYLSQQALTEVAVLAKLMLESLRQPEGWRDSGAIVTVLNAIWAKAEALQNDINAEAEDVGCNYVDPMERECWKAAGAAAAERHV